MRITHALLVCCLAVAPAAAGAQVRSGAAVKWGPGPGFLPAGARLAVMQGDPGQSGDFTIRLRFPPGYRIPPHYHPTEEHITVLSGTFIVGMGDSVSLRGTQRLTAGGFITAPKQAHHFALSRAVTIVQVQGEGPFEITYVNSANDPRNAPAKP